MIPLICTEPHMIRKMSWSVEFKEGALYFANEIDEYGHYHFKYQAPYHFSVDGFYFEELEQEEAKLANLLFN